MFGHMQLIKNDNVRTFEQKLIKAGEKDLLCKMRQFEKICINLGYLFWGGGGDCKRLMSGISSACNKEFLNHG